MSITDFITDYTFRNVILGSGLIGLLSGVIGSYAVMRKQSLIGDALAHSTLPGIVIAFLITGVKTSFVFLLGAGLAAWIANIFVVMMVRNSKLKPDAALGITMSVFFGIGIFLLTVAQKLPNARQAGLEAFIFGQAATIIEKDVILLAIVSIIIFLILIIFNKEFSMISFDKDYTYSLGFSTKILDIFISTLIVITIVVGLELVGVILISSLLIAPAVAARQFTDRINLMLVIAGLIGLFAGVIGAILSSITDNLPTGPTIIVVVTTFVVFSLFFAPKHGIIWQRIIQRKNRSGLQNNRILSGMYNLARENKNYHKPQSIEVLAFLNIESKKLSKHLTDLKQKQYIEIYGNEWVLTRKGLKKIKEFTEKKF